MPMRDQHAADALPLPGHFQTRLLITTCRRVWREVAVGDGNGAGDLDLWLAPFLDVLGRKTRRAWAPFYLRGLLGPGERKSMQPMAARLGLP